MGGRLRGRRRTLASVAEAPVARRGWRRASPRPAPSVTRPAVRERGKDIVELTVAKAARVLEEICAFEMPVPAGETD
jgi:hypothetical protein